MKKPLSVLLLAFLLSSCSKEPVYRGLSFVTFNYTPLNVETVRVQDHDGNKGGAGSIGPGGGEGSVSCCGSLRGTEFDVYWTAIDGDDSIKHMFDGKLYDFVVKKKATVHFPAAEVPQGNGPLMLQVHIYPDEHIEFALSRDLGGTRIPIVAVSNWMMKNFGNELNPHGTPYAEYGINRKVARVISDAWKKYRLEDEKDLRQYVYLAMLVNPTFDKQPQFERLLTDKGRKRGDFARLVESLPMKEIAASKEVPVKGDNP